MNYVNVAQLCGTFTNAAMKLIDDAYQNLLEDYLDASIKVPRESLGTGIREANGVCAGDHRTWHTSRRL